MKRTVTISVISILAVVILFFSLYFVLTSPAYTGEFSISEFSEEIQNVSFHVEKTYGSANDYKSAAVAGKAVINERFESSDGSIFEWRGCDVKYDKENDVYHVRTYNISLFPVFGGAYDVIIKSDGTILAIWGEK